MLAAEKIQQFVQRLPQALQMEVLDFVEFLLTRIDHKTAQQEDVEWSTLSLAFALRGMELEDMPAYTTADLKVVFL